MLQPGTDALSAAALTDALGRIVPHRAHLLDLVSPTPGRKLFGRAVTIRYIPYRADLYDENQSSFARFFFDAVDKNSEGAVLVLDSSGQHDVSIGGAAKFSRLHHRRLAGLVTDARIRDFDDLAGFDPVFYCRGEAVRAGTADLMPVAANVPVSLYGTTVLPGDYIYADSSGLVVIPSGTIEQVLESAAALVAEEKTFLRTGRGERPEGASSERRGEF